GVAAAGGRCLRPGRHPSPGPGPTQPTGAFRPGGVGRGDRPFGSRWSGGRNVTRMEPAILDATSEVADWDGAKQVLMEAFALSQAAARDEQPVVYVVHG